MRIAVTTGGGDAPGLNAVIRAVVKTARRRFGWEVLGLEDSFLGLIDTSHVVELNHHYVRGILDRGGTILGTTNKGNPFDYEIKELDGSSRKVDLSDKCMENWETLGLDAIVVIGGDGTMDIAQRFVEKGMKVIGVPKTIDNDLLATDYTFGYRTAVSTAMDALDRLHSTAESHHRTMILEVMGRNAGWIALEAGIAGGADLILMPEIPYDLDAACKHIKKRYTLGSKFCIAVVAEAAVPSEAYQADYETRRKNDTCGSWFAEQVAERLKVDTRTTVLGHIQRGGSPVSFDRVLGTRFGVRAVEMIAEEKFGEMVVLRGRHLESVSIKEAAGIQKKVDPGDDIVRTAESLGIFCGRPISFK